MGLRKVGSTPFSLTPMTPDAAERLRELIAERDTLRQRIASALRNEILAAYVALALGGAIVVAVLWAAVSGGMPGQVAGPLIAVIAILTAIVHYLIRKNGLSFVLNIWAFLTIFTGGRTFYVDDPITELRRRLADCERKIETLRGS